jgi:hypothetical protein
VCSRRIRLDDMPFLPGSLDQAVAPDTPPIMVRKNAFPLVRGLHSNPLRSRERRFESCRGHPPANSPKGSDQATHCELPDDAWAAICRQIPPGAAVSGIYAE